MGNALEVQLLAVAQIKKQVQVAHLSGEVAQGPQAAQQQKRRYGHSAFFYGDGR